MAGALRFILGIIALVIYIAVSLMESHRAGLPAGLISRDHAAANRKLVERFTSTPDHERRAFASAGGWCRL